MALIKCKDCGKDVSSTATNCLNCGARIKPNRKKIIIAVIVTFIVCLVAVVIIRNVLYNREVNRYCAIEPTNSECMGLYRVGDESNPHCAKWLSYKCYEK